MQAKYKKWIIKINKNNFEMHPQNCQKLENSKEETKNEQKEKKKFRILYGQVLLARKQAE